MDDSKDSRFENDDSWVGSEELTFSPGEINDFEPDQIEDELQSVGQIEQPQQIQLGPQSQSQLQQQFQPEPQTEPQIPPQQSQQSQSQVETGPQILHQSQASSQPPVYKKKKMGACSIIGCGCLSLIVLIILLAVLAIAIILSENRSWEESFVEDKVRMISVSEESYSDDIYTQVVARAGEFSEDSADVSFIELTTVEVATVLFNVIENTLPEGSKLNEVVIDPGDGEWIIYLDVEISDIDLPLFMLDFKEDDSQGMNIAIENARFGVIKLKRDGLFNILGKINDGYLNGVNFLSESDVTGRELINIELERGSLFIKGELENVE